MKRRCFLLAAGIAPGLAQASDAVLRGRLGASRRIEAPGSKPVQVEADESVRAVLEDPRVVGMDIEIEGRYTSPQVFSANPIHRKPVWTRQQGKRMIVSYWCEICYIRFYVPGTCWCCQKESVLEPKDPTTPERVP